MKKKLNEKSGNLLHEKVTQRHAQALQEFPQRKGLNKSGYSIHIQALQGPTPAHHITHSTAIQMIVTGIKTFQPRRII